LRPRGRAGPVHPGRRPRRRRTRPGHRREGHRRHRRGAGDLAPRRAHPRHRLPPAGQGRPRRARRRDQCPEQGRNLRVTSETHAPHAREEAVLVLEDGRSFRGEAYGAIGESIGEAVFSTGMTGYQETLTDPSYCGQVVVMTAPHVGNTGINDEDGESSRMWVAGYVVRDPARRPSNWRSRRPLDEELAAQGIVGISGIDTRALTRHIRERGAMRVGISSAATDPDRLLAKVLDSPEMVGADLAREVTTPEPYVVPA